MADVAQARILHFLRQSKPPPGAKAELKRTFQEFLLEYAWWYEPGILAGKMARGKPQECYKNATLLTLDDDALIYCEGYALFTDASAPRLHAWVTDGHGRAIDNTWPRSGAAYAGVPFQTLFVHMTALKNHASMSLLNDFQNGFPLLNELGDHPEQWLEQRGRGVGRLK
jgi:hypothetical protein